MTIRAGVLSDTHITKPSESFCQQIKNCFDTCSIIIHAGDITELSILDAFKGKKIHAVHGNMCSYESQKQLPQHTSFKLGSFTIGLTHGAQLGFDIESNLFDLFPEADCMIYGHTHRPICHQVGSRLILNPGSFQSTGRYGAAGTYAIIEAGSILEAKIYSLPLQ